MKWWDQMPWSSFSECWALSQLFHSPLTFIKRLFSSSSLSAIRVVSSAYLRLLIFLLAILIRACVSSSPAFLIMYSAYKLNKQGDNIHSLLEHYITCCPSHQPPWVPVAARTLAPKAAAPLLQLALTGANSSPPGEPQELNPCGQPTCRDGNKTTIVPGSRPGWIQGFPREDGIGD